MFLNYFAVVVLIFVVIAAFYATIAIHDIPHLIAKARNYSHQDAINVAGWVSLFTFHAIRPPHFIWATNYREDRGGGMRADGRLPQSKEANAETTCLRRRIADLEQG